MVEAITSLRLKLLRVVAEHPGVSREKLLSLPGVAAADIAYLSGLDLIREGEPGIYRATHLGQMALKRGL